MFSIFSCKVVNWIFIPGSCTPTKGFSDYHKYHLDDIIKIPSSLVKDMIMCLYCN